ncbi:MAG: hypothetical protein ABFD59_04610, partial [Smithella sp.]
QFEEQITAVESILGELEIVNKPGIRVFNKADRFPDKELLATLCRRFDAVAVSARDKKTLFGLLEKIEAALPNTNFSGRGNYVNERRATSDEVKG